MLEDVGRCWKMLEDVGRSWKILENLGRCGKMLEDVERFRKIAYLSGVLYSTKENPHPEGRSLLGFKASILALVDIIYIIIIQQFTVIMMYGNYSSTGAGHWGLCKYNSNLHHCPGQPWVNCFSIWVQSWWWGGRKS